MDNYAREKTSEIHRQENKIKRMKTKPVRHFHNPVQLFWNKNKYNRTIAENSNTITNESQILQPLLTINF